MKKIINFFTEEDGATAVEYAIMVAVIALVVIVGAGALGLSTNATFTNAASQIPGQPAAPVGG
ncbi:MAG: Flp family type IVb pilin [Desulfobacterales bacterium]